MAQPLRKIFQKNLSSGAEAATPQGRRERAARPEGSGERGKAPAGPASPRRRTLDFSGAATAALGLALAAAVGWAFFMGYLVGRGEHPRRGVESVAGFILPQGSAPGESAGLRQPLPGEEALSPAPEPGAPPAPAEAGAPPSAPEAAGGTAPAPAEAPAASRDVAREPAYPFSRPQGEGLAAWGIRPETVAPGPSGKIAEGQNAAAQPASRNTAPAAPAAAAPRPGTQAPPAPRKTAEPPRPAEPRFDYVFQAAAFKGPVDAERLRGRLEAAGLRAGVRPSGKVRLVVVSVRGGAQEARQVRERLAGMGLGRPILLEKKPVPEKTGGKGRRRSAP